MLLQSFLRSRKPAKKAVLHRLEKKPCSTAFLCFKTPHVLYPAFGVATLSVTPTPQKKRGPCYSHRHTSIGGCSNRQPSRLAHFVCPKSRNANADFNFFRAVTRSQPSSPEKGLPSLWWLSVAATPPPTPKKKAFYELLLVTPFFVRLGCLLYYRRTQSP